MRNYISNFDISKVKFEERYVNEEENEVTLYFIAPKEWLNKSYIEAIHSEISIAYPTDHPEAMFAYVTMSPTRTDEDGNAEDYDWYDLELTASEIKALLDLAKED